jgi:hypothetical protein
MIRQWGDDPEISTLLIAEAEDDPAMLGKRFSGGNSKGTAREYGVVAPSIQRRYFQALRERRRLPQWLWTWFP